MNEKTEGWESRKASSAGLAIAFVGILVTGSSTFIWLGQIAQKVETMTQEQMILRNNFKELRNECKP